MAVQLLPVAGGCLCGSIRYESSAAPLKGMYCHCTMCQRAYGGLYQMTLRFTGATFAYTQGSPKLYRSSAYAQRGFCADCGSPIVFTYEGNPDVWILFGSLDRPGDWPLTKDATWGPMEHFCVESKVSWYEIVDELPQKTLDQISARAPAVEAAGGIPVEKLNASNDK